MLPCPAVSLAPALQSGKQPPVPGEGYFGEKARSWKEMWNSVSPCASFPEALGMTFKAPSPGIGALSLGFRGPFLGTLYTCLLKPADAATVSTIPTS